MSSSVGVCPASGVTVGQRKRDYQECSKALHIYLLPEVMYRTGPSGPVHMNIQVTRLNTHTPP